MHPSMKDFCPFPMKDDGNNANGWLFKNLLLDLLDLFCAHHDVVFIITVLAFFFLSFHHTLS